MEAATPVQAAGSLQPRPGFNGPAPWNLKLYTVGTLKILSPETCALQALGRHGRGCSMFSTCFEARLFLPLFSACSGNLVWIVSRHFGQLPSLAQWPHMGCSIVALPVTSCLVDSCGLFVDLTHLISDLVPMCFFLTLSSFLLNLDFHLSSENVAVYKFFKILVCMLLNRCGVVLFQPTESPALLVGPGLLPRPSAPLPAQDQPSQAAFLPPDRPLRPSIP